MKLRFLYIAILQSVLFFNAQARNRAKHRIGLMEEDRKWSVGIIGGGHYARAYNVVDSIFNNSWRYYTSYKPMPSQYEKSFGGSYAGIDFRYYVGNYFFVNPQVIYSLQGQKYEFKGNYDGDYLEGLILRKFHYIKVPVLVGLNLNLNPVSIRLKAGLHAGFLLSYSENYEMWWKFYGVYPDGITRLSTQLNYYIPEKDGVRDYYYSDSHYNPNPLTPARDLPRVTQTKSKPWPYKRVVWGIDYGIEVGFRVSSRIEVTMEVRGDYEFIDNENKKATNTALNGFSSLYYSVPRGKTHNLTAGGGLGIHYLFLK